MKKLVILFTLLLTFESKAQEVISRNNEIVPMSSGGGGGGDVTIGNPVVGGEKFKHIYVDGHSELGQDPFYYKNSSWGFNTDSPSSTIDIVGSNIASPGINKITYSNIGLEDAHAVSDTYSGSSNEQTILTVWGAYITVADASGYNLGDTVKAESDDSINGVVEDVTGNVVLISYNSSGNHFVTGENLIDDTNSFQSEISIINDNFLWEQPGGATGETRIIDNTTPFTFGTFGLRLRFDSTEGHEAGGQIFLTPNTGSIYKFKAINGSERETLDYAGNWFLYRYDGTYSASVNINENSYFFGNSSTGNYITLNPEASTLSVSAATNIILNDSIAGASTVMNLPNFSDRPGVYSVRTPSDSLLDISTTADGATSILGLSGIGKSYLRISDGSAGNQVSLISDTSSQFIIQSGATGLTEIKAPVVYLNGNIKYDTTVTPPGITGDVTINKTSGSVNFALGETDLIWSNSLVSEASIITCTIAASDTFMTSLQIVQAPGSFTIYPNNPPAGETRVNCLIFN